MRPWSPLSCQVTRLLILLDGAVAGLLILHAGCNMYRVLAGLGKTFTA